MANVATADVAGTSAPKKPATGTYSASGQGYNTSTSGLGAAGGNASARAASAASNSTPPAAEEPKTLVRPSDTSRNADKSAGGGTTSAGTGTGSGGGSGKGGSGGGGSGYGLGTSLNIDGSTAADAAAARRAAVEGIVPDTEPVDMDRVDYYDRQYLTDLATQEIEAERQRQNQQIDRTMDTQAAQLNRALADAQGQFQVQQDQIARDERIAMDNAALYAEARGDRGGIGQAQYNSIQNTAAQNRLAVSQAQTKLATDTARQISDLRAQGEFDRADRMLELTQTYLSELRAIEQYAANYNLSVDQMNTAIAEWEADFNRASQQYAANMELSLAQITGAFGDGTPTYQAYQDTLNAQASLALNMIKAGVKPTRLSSSQLGALSQVYGMDQTAINALYLASK